MRLAGAFDFLLHSLTEMPPCCTISFKGECVAARNSRGYYFHTDGVVPRVGGFRVEHVAERTPA